MTKQVINVGAEANDKQGDSLRAAFQKVNSNFTELYTALGLNADTTLNLGNFKFTNNTITLIDPATDGSTLSTVTIDQPVNVGSDLTVGGDLLPSAVNGGDLGSLAKPWKSLYVSNNTIYIGNTAVGINQSGQLTVAGSQVNSIDRLTASGDEVVLIGGANPYTLFPAITGGDQLIIQGAEVSSVSGSLALTSQDNLNIIANGSGAAPGGSKNWTFGTNGDLTVPRDIIAAGNVGEFGSVKTNYVSHVTGQTQIQIGDGNTSNGKTITIIDQRVRIMSAVPATSIGSDGDYAGSVAFNSSYMYYCTANYNGVTNIWKRVAWSGDTW